MKFLLDTNVLSEVIRRPRTLFSRLQQHAGSLATSRICLAELYVWAYRSPRPATRLTFIGQMLNDIAVVEFDDPCAQMYGRLRNRLKALGLSVDRLDLLIAASAVVNNLIVMTRNIGHFGRVPGLQVVDWIGP